MAVRVNGGRWRPAVVHGDTWSAAWYLGLGNLPDGESWMVTARAVDCPGLSQYLLSFESQAVTYGERLADEAKARLRAATKQLFGKPTVSDYPRITEEGR